MADLMTTREVAKFLSINEKMVYTLVAEKGLPASKITGKWLFPLHLVRQWVENQTINYPEPHSQLPPYDGILILAGSNDMLLEKAINLFNRSTGGHLAVFGNLGSLGGLQALRAGCCHIATSHLLQENSVDYNFEYAAKALDRMPAIVNFCRREQGLLLSKGNPKKIRSVADLVRPGVRIINRSVGTGTRLLLDRELEKAGVRYQDVDGYTHEVQTHLGVGLEIISGNADAGPAIRAVAGILNLDFIPLRWERYDFMIAKERFFDEGVQRFLRIVHEERFQEAAERLSGYDLSSTGQMLFPKQKADNDTTPKN
jgi:excisionase family DNA binding protein